MGPRDENSETIGLRPRPETLLLYNETKMQQYLWRVIKERRLTLAHINGNLGIKSGPCFNLKTVFPRYGDSHVKDKTVGETVLSLTWESLYW